MKCTERYKKRRENAQICKGGRRGTTKKLVSAQDSEILYFLRKGIKSKGKGVIFYRRKNESDIYRAGKKRETASFLK